MSDIDFPTALVGAAAAAALWFTLKKGEERAVYRPPPAVIVPITEVVTEPVVCEPPAEPKATGLPIIKTYW